MIVSLIRFAQVFPIQFFYFPLLFLLFIPSYASAHELRPAIVTLEMISPDGYQVSIKTNIEAWIADVGSEHDDTNDSPNAAHYNALRRMAPEKLQQSYDVYQPMLLHKIGLMIDGEVLRPEHVEVQIPAVGDVALSRDSVLTLTGTLPSKGRALQWRWDEKFGAYALTVLRDGQEVYTLFQTSGLTSERINYHQELSQTAINVFTDYVVAGFTHIIPKGMDHILFVVGLFLLSMQWRPLLWQVTSFTLAHSITLTLGMLGIIVLPGVWVEALIALSIVYVGVENIFLKQLSPWRPVVIFMFGLLHGLGFASVLNEFGLQSEHFFAGLLGFNVGVELGQLAVIAICVLAVGLWFRDKPWYRLYVTMPASLLIALVGMYWFFERTLLV